MPTRFTPHKIIGPAAALLAALWPGTALAHPGHGLSDNLVAGLLHPIGGLDHVLMIVAVSAWASRLPPSGRAIVAACLALFVGFGALLPVGTGGLLEIAIALTVVGAGMLLALGQRWPLWATASLSAVFALIHGFAHGAEGPATDAAYVLGVVMATGVLALMVAFFAARLKASSIWLRVTGIVSTALGAALGAAT